MRRRRLHWLSASVGVVALIVAVAAFWAATPRGPLRSDDVVGRWVAVTGSDRRESVIEISSVGVITLTDIRYPSPTLEGPQVLWMSGSGHWSLLDGNDSMIMVTLDEIDGTKVDPTGHNISVERAPFETTLFTVYGDPDGSNWRDVFHRVK